jgi:hypothetical protein
MAAINFRQKQRIDPMLPPPFGGSNLHKSSRPNFVSADDNIMGAVFAMPLSRVVSRAAVMTESDTFPSRRFFASAVPPLTFLLDLVKTTTSLTDLLSIVSAICFMMTPSSSVGPCLLSIKGKTTLKVLRLARYSCIMSNYSARYCSGTVA